MTRNLVGDIVGRIIADRVVYEDMRIPGSMTRQAAANNPTVALFRDNGAGSVGVQQLFFQAGSRRDVYFDVQMSHGYLLGGDIFPHVHFSLANANTGTVIWELEYTWASISSVFGTTTVLAPATHTIAVGGEAYNHIVLSLPTISGSPAGVPKGLSSMLCCRLSRRGDLDTYASNVPFLEFDFHYPVDTMGSFGVTAKWGP